MIASSILIDAHVVPDLRCVTVWTCPAGVRAGTVTFLFTDIEDSTRRWEEDPSDMADALRVHDAILRAAIERHDGYVFGTGGDGFSAAFSTAADATAAALESQEQLRDDSAVDFAVRMGLHTGEAIERDRNYFGSEVNRAARLMSIAHGGQVLVSDATEVLVRDRVGLRPLGEHRLRGLRGRMSVYQVLADGLPDDFPVLRSADDVTGNLPQQLSSLIGREETVGEVAELVRSHRLVTLDRRRRGRQDPSRARGRRRGRRRVPRRRLADRAGVGRRSGVGAGGDRHHARHHAAGRHPARRDHRRGARRSAAAARRRQLRARPGRGRLGDRRPSSAARATSRSSPRHARRSASPASRRRRSRRWPSTVASPSDAVTLFVDRAPSRAPRLRAP